MKNEVVGMKEVYETPDIEIVELETEIETTDMLKDSNETDILSIQLDQY